MTKLFEQPLDKICSATNGKHNKHAKRPPELPAPVHNLLAELHARGPTTVGIFRKSPNAKQCKELRHKLETDFTTQVDNFPVTVVASVFKVSYAASRRANAANRSHALCRLLLTPLCRCRHHHFALLCSVSLASTPAPVLLANKRNALEGTPT